MWRKTLVALAVLAAGFSISHSPAIKVTERDVYVYGHEQIRIEKVASFDIGRINVFGLNVETGWGSHYANGFSLGEDLLCTARHVMDKDPPYDNLVCGYDPGYFIDPIWGHYKGGLYDIDWNTKEHVDSRNLRPGDTASVAFMNKYFQPILKNCEIVEFGFDKPVFCPVEIWEYVALVDAYLNALKSGSADSSADVGNEINFPANLSIPLHGSSGGLIATKMGLFGISSSVHGVYIGKDYLRIPQLACRKGDEIWMLGGARSRDMLWGLTKECNNVGVLVDPTLTGIKYPGNMMP